MATETEPKKIISFEQKEYYANRRVCYAQGWSMIYFLQRSKAVAKNPQWSGILGTYFETLKSTYLGELTFLEKQGRLDDREREAAGIRAREKAVEVAFEGVNLDLLEDAWIDFTLDLSD